MRRFPWILATATVCGCAALAVAADGTADHVDFRYSPPQWQCAICLPDDPQKSLVDKSGELLYHYGRGGPDFGTRVGVEVTGDAVWKKQELLSPRVPIVMTYRSAPGLEIVEEAFAVTQAKINSARPARGDLILVHVTNTTAEARTIRPKLKVDSRVPVAAAVRMTGPEGELQSLLVPAGRTATFAVQYGGVPLLLRQALDAREQAVEFWQRKAGLPFGRIEVPDAGIQALVDSSIRNIWQAREIKNGMTAFQVGPTVYRGLWIVDGAFLLEAATILGAGDQARNGVAYELTRQKPDGRIEVLPSYWKENGIVLWTCVRHAQLTQDKAWLESVWPKLQRIAAAIRTLRRQTLGNNAPDEGLMPPGFPDGGIGGNQHEYTNVYWNLLGLRWFAEAARWLGKADEAAAWQKEYDDFYAAFRRAAARDMKTDPHGNRYLPIRMDGQDLPQRAQWGFCHGVYPGQLFAKDDPLVAGNMAMLQATEREGMVYGTGWNATGIWNYFASFYGHAWLWQGNGRKAAQVLYAYANHASPVLDWREEQSLRGAPYRKVGDMPHNWASAEFIRLVVHLLALDRGNELHLFEGLPAAWTRPGMATRLNGVATPFGKLVMELKIAADGKTALLRVEPLSDPSCKKIVVHLSGWAGAAENAVLEFDPAKRIERRIPLARGSAAAAVPPARTNALPSTPPADCPFKPSTDITGIRFTGRHAEYANADTWYPSWAADGKMYSPWTDGMVNGLGSNSWGKNATTGFATIVGDDPLHLTVIGQGVYASDPSPYAGRYPCGSLVYKGVWYYGTYCLHPSGWVTHDGRAYNWPWMGPFVGFRWSRDFGKTWTQTPCTPAKSLFGESALHGEPVKIGAPHFVDFGKELQRSPDGRAYLVAHGAHDGAKRRYAYDSWITGDEIYLVRVAPSIENMNDAAKYEFFDGAGWTRDFARIRPLAQWRDHMGCVTMTYDAPLKKYLMCVTDGGDTTGYYNSYILESGRVTGPFRLAHYLRHFGQQGYFLNLPSKFISPDGRTLWLCYAANFAPNSNGTAIQSDPPGSRYGMCLQEIELQAR